MKRTSMLMLLVTLLSGCAAAQTSGPGGQTQPPTGGAQTSTAGGGTGGGSGANGFEGTLTSSGLYSATWTVSPDQEVTPFTLGVTLVSDKGTFGNISVSPEGEVSFGSGVSELLGQFTGSTATVTLDPNDWPGAVPNNRFVCAFTVDTDVKSSRDGSVTLHLAGSLAVHWHPSGLGGINCP